MLQGGEGRWEDVLEVYFLHPACVSFSSFLNSETHSQLTSPSFPRQNVPGPLPFYFCMCNLAPVVPVSCPRGPIFKAIGFIVLRGTNTFTMVAQGKN